MIHIAEPIFWMLTGVFVHNLTIVVMLLLYGVYLHVKEDL